MGVLCNLAYLLDLFFRIVCVSFMGFFGAMYCPHFNCERDPLNFLKFFLKIISTDNVCS